MAEQTNIPDIADDLAISVEGVSKTYSLWSSPHARLQHALMGVGRRFLPMPDDLAARIDAKRHSQYQLFHALHDVSFQIKKGESWGIIGVNGSGKSTLLKMVSGNLRPSTGRIVVDGKVALLDYSSGLHGEFTGRENVYLKAAMMGMTRREIDDKFDSIAAFADIGEFIHQPVKTYSSGMTARLGFAIVAHANADIIISDEALAVGDAFFVQKCMRFIRKFVKDGTFLFVSHSTNDVMSLCDNALWLEHGKIVQIGPSKEVCEAYMASVVVESSKRFRASQKLEANVSESGQQESEGPATEELALDQLSPDKAVHFSAEQLAALKQHYAPKIQRTATEFDSIISVQDGERSDGRRLTYDQAIGGGRIFSVTLTDDNGAELPFVSGGETITLTIRAVAEKPVKRPLLGFQLKNHRGLALVGENTEAQLHGRDFALRPGEVVCVRFRFMMPLVAAGDYVVGVAFHDGAQDDGAALEAIPEALLLRCQTLGDRHGLVGAPMLAIDIEREVGLFASEDAAN